MDELDAARVVFANDPTHVDTFYGETRMRQPEKLLMLSVLVEAIDDLGRDKRLRDHASAWIFGTPIDPDWLFTFVNICEELGKDPSYLRKALKIWMIKRYGKVGDVGYHIELKLRDFGIDLQEREKRWKVGAR